MKLFNFEDWVQSAIQEDIGPGDITSLATIPKDKIGRAKLLVKEKGVLAGVYEAKRIINFFDPSIEFEELLPDGAIIEPGDVAFKLMGRSQSITSIERLTLNVMQRMSGIATKTYELTQKIKHTNCKILDTRKTTPNFRYFERKKRIGMVREEC
ncbi:MAG: nicotinate-nucleotide diphosphorylase [Bacteroidota bacterium]